MLLHLLLLAHKPSFCHSWACLHSSSILHIHHGHGYVLLHPNGRLQDPSSSLLLPLNILRLHYDRLTQWLAGRCTSNMHFTDVLDHLINILVVSVRNCYNQLFSK